MPARLLRPNAEIRLYLNQKGMIEGINLRPLPEH